MDYKAYTNQFTNPPSPASAATSFSPTKPTQENNDEVSKIALSRIPSLNMDALPPLKQWNPQESSQEVSYSTEQDILGFYEDEVISEHKLEDRTSSPDSVPNEEDIKLVLKIPQGTITKSYRYANVSDEEN